MAKIKSPKSAKLPNVPAVVPIAPPAKPEPLPAKVEKDRAIFAKKADKMKPKGTSAPRFRAY